MAVSKFAIRSLFLACIAAAPSFAYAQADRSANRFDSRQSRRQAAVATTPVTTTTAQTLARTTFLKSRTTSIAAGAPTPPAKPEWDVEFGIEAPLTFNTNPENVSSKKDGDGHVDPSFQLAVTRKTPRGLLTVTVQGDMDLNFDRPANDSTTVAGSINYDFNLSWLGGAKPYVSYQAADAYVGQFDEHDVTLHDFSAGANYATPDPEVEPEIAPLKFSASGGYTRREASDPDANQHRFGVEVGWSKGISKKLGWSLSQAALYKNYTAGKSDGRDDLTFTTTAALDVKLTANVNLSFTAQFERNESSKAGKDYTAWDIGPTLSRSF